MFFSSFFLGVSFQVAIFFVSLVEKSTEVYGFALQIFRTKHSAGFLPFIRVGTKFGVRSCVQFMDPLPLKVSDSPKFFY